MEINKKLSSNDLTKVAKLIVKAAAMGMDVSGYGYSDVNNSSGNVYLWLEDYPFCLYIPLNADYKIYANWSCPIDGEEHSKLVGSNRGALERLNKWCDKLQAKSDKKEGA